MKKQLLFENVDGNQFKLNTNYIDSNSKAGLIREGLKKVFQSANGKSLTYTYVANIGMGYIKDVSEARKCALQEARYIAETFGYTEDVDKEMFVKENDANITPPDSTPIDPVQIGQQILHTIEEYLQHDLHPYHEQGVEKIRKLAQQLVQLSK